ncbi:MAG TPA: transglutaminase-like domain-containing protein [Tepidisphaeraceae bacterium]|jgi:transglutaminase-like putative cysteine protease|nr:transglutaminase-like domain-containing protein [Tepidisphaeraceae bacterium]
MNHYEWIGKLMSAMKTGFMACSLACRLLGLAVVILALGCEFTSTTSRTSSPPIAKANESNPPSSLSPAVGTLKNRTFDFTYSVRLTGLGENRSASIWIPIPTSNEFQTVQQLSELLPAADELQHERTAHCIILFLRANSHANDQLAIKLVYRITRREACEMPPARDDTKNDSAYLMADKLVPIGGKPMKLLAGVALGADSYAQARTLYDVVDDHMKYRKDKPGWGRGDAAWACESGFGNCTDFHSLFISLARSNHLPAKFEIGFGIPEARGSGIVPGYHCWAWVKPAGHGWVPVDISEASKHPDRRDYFFGHLCENRVQFSSGRDLVLSPPQNGPPLNFFVYPYVEVDGRAWPPGKMITSFTYADVPVDSPSRR